MKLDDVPTAFRHNAKELEEHVESIRNLLCAAVLPSKSEQIETVTPAFMERVEVVNIVRCTKNNSGMQGTQYLVTFHEKVTNEVIFPEEYLIHLIHHPHGESTWSIVKTKLSKKPKQRRPRLTPAQVLSRRGHT